MGPGFGPRLDVVVALLCAAATGAAAQAAEGAAGKTVRLIAPELIAPAPSSGELERLPALVPPPAVKAVKRSVVGADAHFRLLPLPIAEAAGLFVADGFRVALAGIGPPDRSEKCGADGWPCGAAALTAFRAAVRGRSLRCRVPDERPSGNEIIVTSCTLGGRDIAAWLVEQGWARRSGDAYAAEELGALRRRRGVHGSAPAAYVPSFPSISAQVSGTP